MTQWDPEQYLQYRAERLRPAVDLIQRISLASPRRIVDLGCGTGTVTALLSERWPEASTVGIDASDSMLDRARAELPGVDWVTADLTQWRPDDPVDLLFSNAALHWLGDHKTLLPKLLEHVRPGGVMAVQMPNNFAAPTHTAIEDTLRAGRWKALSQIEHRVRPIREPAFYYDLLAPLTAELDVWETTYYHILEGDDPVVEWTRGSVLRPVLRALDETARASFLEGYRKRLREAYPPRPDGKTVLPFKRFFFVASR